MLPPHQADGLLRCRKRIHAARLEDEVLRQHPAQRQCLRALVHGGKHHHAVRASDAPGHLEGVGAAGRLDHAVGAAVVGEFAHRGLHGGEVHAARVYHPVRQAALTGEGEARGVDVDRDDGGRLPRQAGAHHGGEADRAGADHGHRGAGLDLGDARTPVARGHNVAQEEGVFVGHVRGDGRARMVRMRHAHKLGLAAVLAATELPTAFHAVVDPAALAVEALAAERLAAHSHAVAGLEGAHALPHLLDHAHELMAEHRIRRGARHGAVNDVQVARADGRARDADNCVGWGLQLRLGAILERDMSAAVVYQGFHEGLLLACSPAMIRDPRDS